MELELRMIVGQFLQARVMRGFRKLLGQSSPEGQIGQFQSFQEKWSSFKMRGSFMFKSFNFASPAPKRAVIPQDNILTQYAGEDNGVKLERLTSGQSKKTFFIFSSQNRFRTMAGRLVYSPIFENFILICILITTVTLILERPDDIIIGDACPKAPSFLNCSGLPLGQTSEINCARDLTDPNFGRVWESCDSKNKDMVPPCCNIMFRIKLFKEMDIAFTLIFTAEMVCT